MRAFRVEVRRPVPNRMIQVRLWVHRVLILKNDWCVCGVLSLYKDEWEMVEAWCAETGVPVVYEEVQADQPAAAE
jgi:hypothetical protein